jgi:hypothetical protein
MKKDYIRWTKVYNLNHQNGFFQLYVSLHTDGNYHGIVLYYTKTGDWSFERRIDLKMEMEHFSDQSEDGVYQQCVKWVDENLPGTYRIDLIETR